MPWWAWVAIGAGGTLAIGSIPIIVYARRMMKDWDRAWGYGR